MKITQNIKEVFKTLKRRKPAKIYCPRCGSPNIHLSSSFDYWLTPKKYVCEDCGYVGPIVMELEKEEKTKTS
ncbi:hypothetical protein J7L33_06365 [Candidatus Bathyarchaeota archaeon]|nr:hypothetical protein [Candidatus Bathyarchaeota archaeon]